MCFATAALASGNPVDGAYPFFWPELTLLVMASVTLVGGF